MKVANKTRQDSSVQYNERLENKYIRQDNNATSTWLTESTARSNVEMYSELPANPSLTDSERRHYSRAMKVIGQTLRLSEDCFKSNLKEFERIMQLSSSTNGTAEVIESNLLDARRFAENYDKTSLLPVSFSNIMPSTTESTQENASEDGQTVTTSIKAPVTRFDNDSQNFTDVSSLLEIDPSIVKPISVVDARVIYGELMHIHSQIQLEKKVRAEQKIHRLDLDSYHAAREKQLARREAVLLEKEKAFHERESTLSLAMQNIEKTSDIAIKLEGVELDVLEKIKMMKKKHQAEVDKLNSMLISLEQEKKRVKSSFEVVKEQNSKLRAKCDCTSEECRNLKSQNVKLKKRLENLQRKQEFHLDKLNPLKVLDGGNSVTKSSAKPADKVVPKSTATFLRTIEVMQNWIVESVLKVVSVNQMKTGFELAGMTDEFLIDKCLKILPLYVDILRISSSQLSTSESQFSYLTFIHMCLRHVDEAQQSILSSTLRRLGEELYKPGQNSSSFKKKSCIAVLATETQISISGLEEVTKPIKSNSSVANPSFNLYFWSDISEIRALSCLIILKTLHQVDTLAHAFKQLQKELKHDSNRKLFLDYMALDIILPYISYRANKALLGEAIDILLQMAMESPLLSTFLEQCSRDECFRVLASALRECSHSFEMSFSGIFEKIIVVLQKLSKIKRNKKYFDAFSVGCILQECYHSCDPNNSFLALNLKSILTNLDFLRDS